MDVGNKVVQLMLSKLCVVCGALNNDGDSFVAVDVADMAEVEPAEEEEEDDDDDDDEPLLLVVELWSSVSMPSVVEEPAEDADRVVDGGVGGRMGLSWLGG